MASVWHVGGGTLTPYHEHLLHTAAYGKGRARPQFELHFRKLPIEPVCQGYSLAVADGQAKVVVNGYYYLDRSPRMTSMTASYPWLRPTAHLFLHRLYTTSVRRPLPLFMSIRVSLMAGARVARIRPRVRQLGADSIAGSP
eukprot:scaffold547_cov384-Prasinococcus_capsulatus_cf.AAC.13